MKAFICFIIASITLSSCKPKKQTVSTSTKDTYLSESKTIGKISHQYQKNGCPSVIIITNKATQKPLVLAPVNNLDATMDIDGLEITFKYHLSKRPQPEGCTNGIPAKIIEIEKSRK